MRDVLDSASQHFHFFFEDDDDNDHILKLNFLGFTHPHAQPQNMMGDQAATTPTLEHEVRLCNLVIWSSAFEVRQGQPAALLVITLESMRWEKTTKYFSTNHHHAH